MALETSSLTQKNHDFERCPRVPRALAQQQEVPAFHHCPLPAPIFILSPFHTPAGTGALKLGNSQGKRATGTLPKSFSQAVGMRISRVHSPGSSQPFPVWAQTCWEGRVGRAEPVLPLILLARPEETQAADNLAISGLLTEQEIQS